MNLIEKGNILINQGWDDDNKLIEKINECINIEYNIKNIIEINESIEKCNSKKNKCQIHTRRCAINGFIRKY